MDVYKSTRTKYDVPLDHLEYSYVETCTDVAELEKIVKVLRSGVEGVYPDLELTAEKRLAQLAPDSKVLRKSKPLQKMRDLNAEQQSDINSVLQNWTTLIKGSEDSTLLGEAPLEGDDNLPPVRGKHTSISMSGKTSAAPVKTKQAKPRSFTDWDKIDIDAELEKVDAGGGGRAGGKGRGKNVLRDGSRPQIPQSLSSADMTDEERRQKAAREKDKGNEAFKAADYEEALVYYHRSLSLDQAMPVYNNRSQTYLKLDRWQSALDDADVVLKGDGQNVKALLRRALACRGLRRFSDAKLSLTRILELQPENKKAKEVLNDIRESLAEQKVKGRRMVIEEVDGSESDEGSSDDAASAMREDAATKTTTMTNGFEQREANDEPSDRPRDLDPLTSGSAPAGSDEEMTTDGPKPSLAEWPTGRVQSNAAMESDDAAAAPRDTAGSGDAVESSPVTPVIVGALALPAEVGLMKLRGNEMFRAGQYAEAIGEYSAAIDALTPDCEGHGAGLATLYSNRAACRQKTGDCRRCIDDCSHALTLTPGSAKVTLRRAVAYETSEKHRQAYVDFRQVLLQESQWEIAQAGATRCSSLLLEQDGPSWRDKLPAASPVCLPVYPPVYPAARLPQPAVHAAPMTRQPVTTPTSDRQTDADYDRLKGQGNNFVQKGEHTQAIHSYTLCIQLQSERTVGYTNRALCYLRTNQPEKAIDDCSFVLSKEPKNVKALFRRSQAYKMVCRYDDSLSDLDRVLMEEKRNKTVLTEVEVVRTLKTKKLQDEEKAKQSRPPDVATGRRRINIVEVESSSDEEEETASATASRGVTGTADPVAVAVDRPSGGDDVPRESSRPAVASVDEVRVEIPGSPPGGGGGRAGRRAPPRRTQSSDPVTPFAFMHEWTALKAAAGCRPYAALLARIEPTQLPKVISNKLDGPMLQMVIRCARLMITDGKRSEAFTYLKCLTSVQRFQVVAMFLSSDDKKDVDEIFSLLAQPGGEIGADDLEATHKAYR